MGKARRERDEKFRLLLVRLPLERNAELMAACKEIGLKPTQFIVSETLKALNARKGTIPAAEQASTVNS